MNTNSLFSSLIIRPETFLLGHQHSWVGSILKLVTTILQTASATQWTLTSHNPSQGVEVTDLGWDPLLITEKNTASIVLKYKPSSQHCIDIGQIFKRLKFQAPRGPLFTALQAIGKNGDSNT